MNPPAFTQIVATAWPSGYPESIAVTRVQPGLFAREFGLEFSDGFDNLDRYEAATVRLRSGRILGAFATCREP